MNYKLYSDIPEALENNYNFHLRFNFKPKNLNQFYHLSLMLRAIHQKMSFETSKEGLENRIKILSLKKNLLKIENKIKNIYEDRLKHEINIINSMDYASYFLIVSDYIKWAKKIQYLLDLEEVLELVLWLLTV